MIAPPPAKGVNEWATVTDALTNVLFDGITDRGGEKGLRHESTAAGYSLYLKGLWHVPNRSGGRPVGKSVGKHVALSIKQRQRGV